MTAPPRFVALEGVEGAGKTTQVRSLCAWLTDCGVPHVSAREPGGTHLGESIRQVLLDRPDLEIPARAELLLMVAARTPFLEQVVKPALAAGDSVIADRSELSTLAYQGYGRGLDLEVVRRANEVATAGFRPELTMVLDLDVAQGHARQRADGKVEDRIEGAGAEFLQRVRDGYRHLAAEDGSVVLIDASRPVDEVQSAIRRCLSDRFPETFPSAAR